MALPRLPHAVIFDMDGLIFDSETLYREAATAAAAALGNELPPELYRATIGLNGPAARELLMAHFGAGFDFETLWVTAREHYQRLASTQLCLKAGVVELLDALDQARLPRAIATSSRRESVEHHLALHKLAHRFPVVVAHGDYERGKPYPDPYLIAATRLGIAPELCLALEDSHNGVRAAAAAGMMTVMVPDLLEATEEMHGLCIRIARDLHEVRAMLAA
jgi:HAD superfamily hydrolase (TIGR01509 family)